TDDYINMPLQASTQWDGLSHFAYADALYNGFWLGNVETISGANRCSIHNQKETLCGRGVLLDVARHKGVKRLDPGYGITPDDLGLSLGEIWNLDPIAEDCAGDGRYEFFVAAQPLNLTNASGSPLNPIAIK